MFNLIVKDPCRTPPERAALDQECTAELCVLELAALQFSWNPIESSYLSAFTETTDFSGACQWAILPTARTRLQHQI
jgi:hypothetical protein